MITNNNDQFLTSCALKVLFSRTTWGGKSGSCCTWLIRSVVTSGSQTQNSGRPALLVFQLSLISSRWGRHSWKTSRSRGLEDWVWEPGSMLSDGRSILTLILLAYGVTTQQRLSTWDSPPQVRPEDTFKIFRKTKTCILTISRHTDHLHMINDTDQLLISCTNLWGCRSEGRSSSSLLPPPPHFPLERRLIGQLDPDWPMGREFPC